MKKFSFILLAICLCTLVCKAEVYNFEDYLYPFGCRTYSTPDNKGNLLSVTQYSFVSQAFDNYLVKEVYIGIGVMSSKTTYRYQTKGNAVISDVQLKQDILTGSTKYQERLTLFAFPKGEQPYQWTEIENGEKYQCTSEYVYVNASLFHASFFTKAIKITRDLTYFFKKEKHRVTEKSYWVSGYGRIITMTNWDGEERATSKLDILDYYQEISPEEYNAYIKKKEEALQKQKEEEALLAKKREEEAILKKKIEAFNKANKPQSFEHKYPIYRQQVTNIIESYIDKLDIFGEEPMVVTIASSNDIRIEDGAFSSAPKIGESVKEYIKGLLKERKVHLDTLINPETNISVEIPLVLKVDQIPVVETKYFSLDYKNGTWYEKGSKTPFYRTSALENEIYTSAEEFRLTKKAKKVNVPVNYISFNNKLFSQNVGKACIRKD